MAIAMVGLIWGGVFLSLHGYQNRPPFAEEANIAIHLTLGHGFLSPMDPASSAPPSAWSPPVYPFVIATVYRCFGIATPQSVTMLMLINAACFGAVAAGIFTLSYLLFQASTPGLLAAILLMLDPVFLFFAGDFWDGMLALSMFVWLCVVATILGHAAEHPEISWEKPALALGVLMGLLALTNSCYLLGYPVILWIAFSRNYQQRWQQIGITLVALLLLTTPWMVRNAATLNGFYSLRSGMGLQLWLGNQTASDGWLEDRATYANHPYFNQMERQTLLAIGEPAYNDLCTERFYTRLKHDPLGFAMRSIKRLIYLFVGNLSRPSEYPFMLNLPWKGLYVDKLLLSGAVALFGIGGSLVAWRLGFRIRGVSALAVCVILPYLPTAVLDRYSLPLRALLVMFFAFLLWIIVFHVRHRGWGRIEVPQRG